MVITETGQRSVSRSQRHQMLCNNTCASQSQIYVSCLHAVRDRVSFFTELLRLLSFCVFLIVFVIFFYVVIIRPVR